MKYIAPVLSVFLLAGCDDNKHSKIEEFLSTEIKLKPEFGGTFRGVEQSQQYVVFDGADNAQIYTHAGVMNKQYEFDGKKLTVTMATSSQVHAVPLNFIPVMNKLVCTTCSAYNLDMEWFRVSSAKYGNN